MCEDYKRYFAKLNPDKSANILFTDKNDTFQSE